MEFCCIVHYCCCFMLFYLLQQAVMLSGCLVPYIMPCFVMIVRGENKQPILSQLTPVSCNQHSSIYDITNYMCPIKHDDGRPRLNN